jgi:hypothetical protein
MVAADLTPIQPIYDSLRERLRNRIRARLDARGAEEDAGG